MAADDRAVFGAALWNKLQQQPFGSLGKRELELAILDAATKAGLLQGTPDAVAASLSLSLTIPFTLRMMAILLKKKRVWMPLTLSLP